MVKESLYYKFLWHTLPLTLRIFYRRIQVTGYDNIPKNSPIIFTSNHQNALMDALIICIMSGRKAFFLARADIFKKKAIADIMYKLRILPVYRTRDGADSLVNNNETFDKSIALLDENQAILIFVEGNHNRERRLRDLKKGYARIAFAAAEKTLENNQLVIVPVGINYTKHLFIQSDVVVNYGVPINMADYLNLYKEKPAAAMHQLTTKLAPEIKKLILSIDDKENIRQIEVIKDINLNQAKQDGILSNSNFLLQLEKEKEIVAGLEKIKTDNEEEYKNIIEDASEYLSILEKHKLSDEFVCLRNPSNKLISGILYAILFFPLLLSGYIFNIVPYIILKNFLKKIKDDHFNATFSFAIGMFLFPIFYLIMILISVIIFKSLPALAISTGVILLSSFCILKLRKILFTVKKLLTFQKLKKHDQQDFLRLKLIRKKLLF
jgi:1-acyl-sn-glycerol-3-phosphate acyltransferase